MIKFPPPLSTELSSSLKSLEITPVSKLSSEKAKNDFEFLSRAKSEKPKNLIQGISEYLIGEKRLGSAEYLDVFFKSTVLDKQLELLEEGKVNKLAGSDIPLMIDTKLTTPELAKNDLAVLTQESRDDLLGAVHSLNYKLGEHINKTARLDSTEFAEKSVREAGFFDKVKAYFNRQGNEQPSNSSPTYDEFQRWFDQKYNNVDEARAFIQRRMEQLMKQHPYLIELRSTASLREYLTEIANELGGDPSKTINIRKLRALHVIGKAQNMHELEILPEFGVAIEDSVEKEYS